MTPTITTRSTLGVVLDSSISGTIDQTVTLGSGGYDSPLTITSTGAIIAPAGGYPAGATGLIVPTNMDGAVIVNDGQIAGGLGNSGEGDGGTGGIGVNLESSGSFANYGTITGGTGGVALPIGSPTGVGGKGHPPLGLAGGVGVDLASGGTITNYGTIIGGTGGTGAVSDGGSGVYLDGGTLITSGTITGGSGSTVGDAVQFGKTAATLVVDPGAVFNGAVVGNGTNDTLTLGSAASAGTLSGLGSKFARFTTITEADGARWTLAGANTLRAGSSLSVAGVLSVSGTLNDAGSVSVTGGGTLSLANGLSGTGTVAIGSGSTLVAANAVSVAGVSFTAGGKGEDFVVQTTAPVTSALSDFGSGDTIDLQDLAVKSATFQNGTLTLYDATKTQIGSLTFDGSYTRANFVLRADAVGGTEILFKAATAPTPTAPTLSASAVALDSSITGTIDQTVTLGSGGYDSPLTITGTGAILAPSGGSPGVTAMIVPTDMPGAVIVNEGQIAGGSGQVATAPAGQSASGGLGVDLASATTLTNDGTITGGDGGKAGRPPHVTGGVSFGGDGGIAVNLAAGGMLINRGTITGGSGGGGGGDQHGIGDASTAPGDGGTGVSMNGGTLMTSGTISGGAGGSGGGSGRYGSVVLGAGGSGVFLNGGTLITSGTISGGAGGRTASGTAAGDAVQFGATAATLVVDPSAVFNGLVVGDGTNDTLGLASGSSAGTLSGLGSEFTGFSTIAEAGGANWTLTGANTLAAGTSLSVAGVLSVSGALTDGGSVTVIGGGTLTLVNGLSGTGTVTIGSGSTLIAANAVSVAGVAFTAGGKGEDFVVQTTAPVTSALSDFGSGDTIDLQDLVAKSATFQNGTLTLYDATKTQIGSLTFDGSYTRANFALRADAVGGTEILFKTVTAAQTSALRDLVPLPSAVALRVEPGMRETLGFADPMQGQPSLGAVLAIVDHGKG